MVTLHCANWKLTFGGTELFTADVVHVWRAFFFFVVGFFCLGRESCGGKKGGNRWWWSRIIFMTLGFFSHLSPRCRTHCSQEKSGARRGRWESSKCGAFELLRPVLRSHVISKKSPYCFPLVINQPLVCVPARYEGLNFQTIMFAKQNATHFS